MKQSVLLSALLLFGLAPAGHASPSFGHKVQVHDGITAQAVVEQGGRLVADYGSFQIYDVPKNAGNLPISAQVRDSYNSILLNAAHLDTSTAAIQSLRKTVGAFEGKRMHLVQFAGPIQPAWRKALLDAGVKIVSYVPQNAYLVYGDAAGIGRVQAMAATAPHVQWEGAYLDEYKIHPRARTVDQNGNPRQIGTDRFSIQLVADAAPNADTLKLIDRLKLAPIERQQSILNYLDVTVRLPAASLAQIAARSDVVSIQPNAPPKKVCERQDQIVAGNLSGNVPNGPGYLSWLEGKGFTQAQFTSSGFVVDVSDSGIDNGTTNPNHFGLYPGGNTSDASRVVYNILQGTPNPGSTLAGCDGHGNINAHIVMGYDNNSGFPFADSDGYHYGLGVCPFVYVGSSVIFDPVNSTGPNDGTVISTAYQHGARISNNSWGDSNPGDDGTYNSDSQAYDALVRNAEQGTSPNHEITIVFAAGNDGPTSTSVSPPGTAKNVITVGAADNVQPFGGQDYSGVGDSEADDANDLTSFSSRGPCDDGRTKPDLIAPGTHVSGGAPQNPDPGPDGSGLTCFLDERAEDIGVSGGVGTNGQLNRFFPDDQQFYTASSGTSHSTPCVSGGCALVRQYFINNSNNPPSPAMTKAFLMNSARYMTGSGADDTLYSDNQGMGEMDLGMAFDGEPRLLRDEEASDMFDASGQTRVFTGIISNPTKPFRVTLAWTDFYGSTTGAAYNNDLDLTVKVGGNTYLGNVFSGANSITGGEPDEVDNVESVFLPAGVSGTFTVTVTAANINSPAVTYDEGQVNQDFALVIYNAGQAPSLAAAGYTLTNTSCATNVAYPAASVTANLMVTNIGTSPASNIVATLLPYLVCRDQTAPGVPAPVDMFDEMSAFMSANEAVFSTNGPQTNNALGVTSLITNTVSLVDDGACDATFTADVLLQYGPGELSNTVTYVITNGSNCMTACAPASVTTNMTIFPTNGFQSIPSFLPALGVTGRAPTSPPFVILSNNGVFNSIIPVDDNGIYKTFALLEFGTNILTISNNVTNTVIIPLAPPILQVAPVVNTNVAIVASGAAGATVYIYDTNSGVTLGSFTLNALGEFSGTLTFPLGNYELTGVEAVGGIASTNAVAFPVDVVPVPAPAISSPYNGALLSTAKQTISGRGAPGAALTVFDTTNGVTGTLATTTVNHAGKFSVAVQLANGENALYAVQEQNSTNSPPSGLVVVNDYYLAPVILFQPENQTNFIGGTVTFSVQVAGAAPLRISWWKMASGKTNWVRVPGASSENLTLSDIKLNDLGSYYLSVSNKYDAGNPVASSSATLTITNNPFSTLAGTYEGLFTEPTPQFDSSGFLTLTLTDLGKFTARTMTAGSSYSFSGWFSGVGWWSNVVSRGADIAPLTVVMDMNVTNGSNQILGTVSDGTNWTANLEAHRALFSAANPFTNQGKFTMIFGGASNTDGYATASVTASGMASLRGALSDNTSIASAAASVSTNGQWPLYIPLYGRFGSLVGWIDFTNAGVSIADLTHAGPCSFVGYNAVWFRTNSDGKYYPNGLTNDLTIVGSSFSPDADALLLDSTNLEVILSGGDLASPLSNNVSPLASGRFTADGTGIPGLTLDLGLGTGILRGSFSDPSMRSPASIKGVIFQQQTNAAGFFLGATNNGSFLLTP